MSLHEIQDRDGAEWASWGPTQIVTTFGEPQAEYAAVRKAAGLIDLPQRSVLELTGLDRHSFLNNLLTNQTFDKSAKAGLQPGQGKYAFLLNLKGRIVCDLNILETTDRTLLEVDARYAAGLAKLFDQYLFADKVKITHRADLHELALHGPGAIDLLQDYFGSPVNLPQPLASMSLMHQSQPVTLWRDDLTGLPGYHLIVPEPLATSIWTDLLNRFGQSPDLGKRRLRPIGWAMFNSLRIEAGRLIFGIDFDGQPIETAFPTKANREAAESASPGILPAETGLLDRAVSFTKGCYLGQEIVARMHARQQVARQIVGFRLQSDALPIAGERVFDPQHNEIGGVTSSTNSPMLSGHAIGFALLKKPFFTLGGKFLVPAEGQLREATVVKTPFVEIERGH